MKSFKIKAYGQEWRVEVAEDHPDMKEDWGVCDPAKNEIRLDGKLREDQQGSTLLHELIELVSTTNNLDIPENVVKILEAGLYHIIHDNKLKF